MWSCQFSLSMLQKWRGLRLSRPPPRRSSRLPEWPRRLLPLPAPCQPACSTTPGEMPSSRSRRSSLTATRSHRARRQCEWQAPVTHTHTHTFILHVRTRYRPRITALFNSAIFVWSCSFIPIMQNRTVIYTYILSVATDECTKECMHWCILEAMIMFPALPAVPPDRPQCLQGHHFCGLWLVSSGEWMAENSRHSSEVVVWNHSSPCCCPDELLTVLNHVPSNIIHSGKTWRAFKRLFWANN